MSEQDEKSLEAAIAAYYGPWLSRPIDSKEFPNLTAAIHAYKAHHKASGGFNWQAAFHKEHDDLCKVESRNYVLKQRIKALEAALREIESEAASFNVDPWCEKIETTARKALGEKEP